MNKPKVEFIDSGKIYVRCTDVDKYVNAEIDKEYNNITVTDYNDLYLVNLTRTSSCIDMRSDGVFCIKYIEGKDHKKRL